MWFLLPIDNVRIHITLTCYLRSWKNLEHLSSLGFLIKLRQGQYYCLQRFFIHLDNGYISSRNLLFQRHWLVIATLKLLASPRGSTLSSSSKTTWPTNTLSSSWCVLSSYLTHRCCFLKVWNIGITEYYIHCCPWSRSRWQLINRITNLPK